MEASEKLRFLYSIPYKNQNKNKEFYKDIKIQSLSKTEKQQNGILSETVVFDCLSLWYEQKETVRDMSKQDGEIRWDFKWDSKFSDYDNRTVIFENQGHTEAPFLLEIEGYVINPCISIYIDGEKIDSLNFNITLEQYEKKQKIGKNKTKAKKTKQSSNN